MPFLTNIMNNLKQFHSGLTPFRKAVLYLLASMIVVALFVTSFWAGDSSYQVLFRSLTPEDSVAVTKWLQEKKIPYLIQEGGATVSVPPEFTSMARIGIMGADVIRADVVGFEIFDKDHFGMTSFVQKLNFKRAQEGELVRTIQSMSNVKRARVSITTPPERTFAKDREEAKASVFLEIEPGARLTKDEVHAITNLVASAVEGLKPESVSIVDSAGRMLSQPKGDGWSAETQHLLSHKMETERKYETQVQSILERIVGFGNAEVRVNVDMDMRRISTRKKEVDPDRVAIISSQKKEDNMQGRRPNPTGVPGSRSEIPGAPQQGVPTVSQDVNKSLETVNYAVPETQVQEERLPGQVERITVAVVLDPDAALKLQAVKRDVAADPAAKSADEAAPAAEAKPELDPQFKTKLESLVASAVGFKKERGDQIHIEVMPFARPEVEEGDKHLKLIERREIIANIVKYGVPSLFLFFFFLWVVRPFIRWVTTSTAEAVENQLPQTVEELEAVTGTMGTLGGLENLPLLEEQIDPDKAEGELLREKLVSMVESAPDKAAQIVAEWLAQDLHKKKDKNG